MCNKQFCDTWWLISLSFSPTQTCSLSISLSKHAPLPSTSAEHTVNSQTWCSASWFAHLTCHLLISEMPPDTHTKHTLAWQAIWKAIQGLLSSANTLSPVLWTIPLISLHTEPPRTDFMWITSQITLSPGTRWRSPLSPPKHLDSCLRAQPGTDRSNQMDPHRFLWL